MNLGKFHHDLTVLPHWKSLLVRGNDPQMALIQVSELLYITQMNGLMPERSTGM